MNPKVGIVLVNYNGANFQNDCVRTIINMKYKNFFIVIVDNNSTDNSISMLENEFNEFNELLIIRTGENCGVAKGNNIGIKKAIEMGAEYVLLLNNDTEVDYNMLTNMVNRASENTMVTPKMYYYSPNNIIWCAGGEINWEKATTIHYGDGKVDNDNFNRSKYVEYTPTCCLLIHSKVFDKVGYMDENYFMYYDDTDFLVRCNNAGIKTWYEATAMLWHKVSSSSGGNTSKISVYYGDRNRLYFIDKFYKKKNRVLIYFYLTRFIKIIRFYFTDKNLSKIMIKAISDYKLGKFYRQEL